MKRVLSFVLALLLICSFTNVIGAGTDSNVSLFVTQPVSFNDWYSQDKQHVDQLLKTYYGDIPGLKDQLYQEWEAITASLAEIENNPTVDVEYQYNFYTANQVGKMHVLILAKNFREKAIDKCVAGVFPSISEYPDLLTGSKSIRGGMPLPKLTIAPETAYIDENEVRIAVKSLIEKQIDKDKLDENRVISPSLVKGMTFYSVPYVIDGASGIASSYFLPGREECIFLSAKANRTEGGEIFNSVRELIAHEIGHFLHQEFLGPFSTSSVKWNAFIDSFGKSYVVSSEWKYLPEENFAEYFRMFYGTPENRVSPFRGGYSGPQTSAAIDNNFINTISNLPLLQNPPWEWQTVGVEHKTTKNSILSYKFGPSFPGSNDIFTNGPEITLYGKARVQTAGGSVLTPSYNIARIGEGSTPQIVELKNNNPNDFMSIASLNYRTSILLKSPGTYLLQLGALDVNKKFVSYVDSKVYYYPKTEDTGFLDTKKHWALPYIQALSKKGIIGGYADGNFWPERMVTRAQFVKMLVDIKGLKKDYALGYCPDVPRNHWAAQYVGAAINAGVVLPNEFHDNKFYPERPITRQEAAALIARAFGGDTLTGDEFWRWGQRNPAKDRNDVDAKYSGYVTYCIEKHYMSGYPDGNFFPRKTLTRAEAAVLLSSLL